MNFKYTEFLIRIARPRDCQRKQNCQIWTQTCTRISRRRMCDLKGKGDCEPLVVASASEPARTTGHSGGSSFITIQAQLHPYTLLIA